LNTELDRDGHDGGEAMTVRQACVEKPAALTNAEMMIARIATDDPRRNTRPLP